MYDAVLHTRERALARSDVLERLQLGEAQFGVATLHRAENTSVATLREVLETLNQVAQAQLPLIFPVHPRTRRMLETDLSGWKPHGALRLIEPLGYLDMIRLVSAARLVLTDSGGLQKEAFFVGCPCITLRTETEWVETVEAGGNVVTGISRDKVTAAVRNWLQRPARPNFARAGVPQPFGDGHASEAIVNALARLAA
jgi:UDP-N-acetylglucosamine 2-epimerase